MKKDAIFNGVDVSMLVECEDCEKGCNWTAAAAIFFWWWYNEYEMKYEYENEMVNMNMISSSMNEDHFWGLVNCR